jgi:hypothetical protein
MFSFDWIINDSKILKSHVDSVAEGRMELEGKSNEFTFSLYKDEAKMITYNNGDPFVTIRGEKKPIVFNSWDGWSQELKIGDNTYSHRFRALLPFQYSLHNVIVCNQTEIADIYSRINGKLLFWNSGGVVRLEIDQSIPCWESLFYSIAWWWTGYFTDNTSH